jgi:hypothetical protein
MHRWISRQDGVRAGARRVRNAAQRLVATLAEPLPARHRDHGRRQAIEVPAAVASVTQQHLLVVILAPALLARQLAEEVAFALCTISHVECRLR